MINISLLFFQGLPIVITISAYVPDVTSDDVPITTALRQLEERGADVVGLNCARGPSTMLPLLKEARKVCKVCKIDKSQMRLLITDPEK